MKKRPIKPTTEMQFEPSVHVDHERRITLAVATDGASVFHIPLTDKTRVVRSAVALFNREYTPIKYDLGVAAHRFLNPTFAELLPTGEAVRVILETIVATYKGKKPVTDKAKAAAGKKVLGAVKYAKNTVDRGRPNDPDSKVEKSYAIFVKHYGRSSRADILALFQKEAKLTEGGAPTYFYLCLKRMRAEYSKAGKEMPQVERAKNEKGKTTGKRATKKPAKAVKKTAKANATKKPAAKAKKAGGKKPAAKDRVPSATPPETAAVKQQVGTKKAVTKATVERAVDVKKDGAKPAPAPRKLVKATAPAAEKPSAPPVEAKPIATVDSASVAVRPPF